MSELFWPEPISGSDRVASLMSRAGKIFRKSRWIFGQAEAMEFGVSADD